jgi:hypothetical protein
MRAAMLFRSILALLPGLIAIAGPIGCGGKSIDGSVGGGGGGNDVDAFANDYASAWCDNIGACCQKFVGSFHHDSCMSSAYVRASVFAELAMAPSPSEIQFNSAQAANCLNAVRAVAAACIAGNPPPIPDDQCGQVFTAKGQPGDSCTTFGPSTTECIPPPAGHAECLDFVSGGKTTGRICTQVVPGAEGEACEPFAGRTSAPLIAVCDESAGLTCDTKTSVCRKAGGSGDSCDTRRCAPGLTCRASVCSSAAMSGESCLDPDMPCAAGLYCPISGQMVCTSMGGAGAPCDAGHTDTTTGRYVECQTGLYCTQSGACAPLLSAGGSCQSDQECDASTFCSSDHVCAARVALGQGCCAHPAADSSCPNHQDIEECADGAECQPGLSAPSGVKPYVCLPPNLPPMCFAQ